MNSSVRLISGSVAPLACALVLTCAPVVSAQTEQTPPATPQTAAQPALATREQRTRAYVKLLEGQRALAGAISSGGISRDVLTRAQASFNEAAALDPTLAEAHVALSEIAFFFLDDMAQAEREAAAATRIAPDNFGGHRLLSRIYALKAGLDEDKLDRAAAERAIKELREVIRLDANDPEGLALLGEYYTLLGRNDEALDAFKRWAAAPPAVDVRFYQVVTQGRDLTQEAAGARLGEALLRAGKTAEALDVIRRALATSPDNTRYLGLLGEALEAGNADNNGALADLKRLVAANPANAVALSLLARTQARANQIDEAVATLRTGIDNRKTGERERSILVEQLAATLADALRYPEAIATYEDALKARGITDQLLTADSDKAFAVTTLQHIIDLQGKAERNTDATATVERMRKLLGPDNPQADFQSALLLRAQGKRREALDAIRAARLKYQSSPPAQEAFLRLEARTLAELGRADEGADLLRAKLTGKPEDDFTIYLNIANLYLDAGHGKEAVAAARKLLELAPADQPDALMQALFMLSSAQERANDLKGAEETLRRVLAKDPNNATALNNLGYFLADHDVRLTDALDMTKRAVHAQPTNPSFLDSLGWAYFKLGQLDEAERYLSDAARRNTRSVAIQEHLGDLNQKRGRTEEARAAWRKALALATEASDTERLKTKLGDARK